MTRGMDARGGGIKSAHDPGAFRVLLMKALQSDDATERVSALLVRLAEVRQVSRVQAADMAVSDLRQFCPAATDETIALVRSLG